jgi:hypothetical protein
MYLFPASSGYRYDYLSLPISPSNACTKLDRELSGFLSLLKVLERCPHDYQSHAHINKGTKEKEIY